jgi:hypothetical protein
MAIMPLAGIWLSGELRYCVQARLGQMTARAEIALDPQ